MNLKIESKYNLLKDAVECYKNLEKKDPSLKKDQGQLQRIQKRCQEAYFYISEQEEKFHTKGLEELTNFAKEKGLITLSERRGLL